MFIILLFAIIFIAASAIAVLFILFGRYNRGFNKKGIHKNGSKYDDFGYDVNEYDKTGYDKNGFNRQGYNDKGYNKEGYNHHGRNAKGQYNRLFDTSSCSLDGFYSPAQYPIIVTTHAKERILQRFSGMQQEDIQKLVMEAYCFGKSKRQVKRSSMALIQKIEEKYGSAVALIYHGFIYIFSTDNKLITMYKNDHIAL